LRGTKFEKGFSLVEALVILGLIGAIVAITMPFLYRFVQSWKSDTAAAELAVNIRFARNAAVKQKLKYKVVINEDPTNTYHIEKETGYNTGSFTTLNSMSYTLPSRVKILTSSTDGPIVFNYRGANESNLQYNIFLQAVSGTTYRISVTPFGGVSNLKTAQ
jgi:Tfp pilus assembly protein FimT